MASSTKKAQPVQVSVRIRPFNEQEKDARAMSAVEVVSSKELSIKQQHGKSYSFDRVFGATSKQEDVYDSVVKPLVLEALAGYNCTAFAYGQTGTGKTYTMVGDINNLDHWKINTHSGIIPRAMAHLFDELILSQQEYSVRVSYVELYNEEIFDLLTESDDANRLRLYEDQKQKGSVIIQGVEEVIVHNKNEVYQLLKRGSEKRRTAFTLMNSNSSRSHTVFTAVVHIRETTEDGEELMKTGKVNFVDLAGSENISRSGSVEKRAREAGSINQSLLTLGRIIKALVEKSAHVPYRESKLTRILQDSLGGRTKTCIIATISPASNNLEETLSTLEYSYRARNITNRPVINQRMSKKLLLNQYTEEIERLKRDLMASRTGHGILLDEENYQRLIAEHDMRKLELTERITEIRNSAARIGELEKCKLQIETNFLECSTSLIETQNDLKQCQDKLKETEKESAEQVEIIGHFAATQRILTKQAETLLKVADESTKNEDILRNKVENLYGVSQQNKTVMNNLIAIWEDSFHTYTTNIDHLKIQHDYFNKALIDILKKEEIDQENILQQIMAQCTNIISNDAELSEKLFDMINKFHIQSENSLDQSHSEISTMLSNIALSVKDEIADITKNKMSKLNDVIVEWNERHKKFVNIIIHKLDFVMTLNKNGLENVMSAIDESKINIYKKIYELNERLETSNIYQTNELHQFTKYDQVLNEKLKYLEDNLKEVKALTLEHHNQMIENFKTKDVFNNSVSAFNEDLQTKLTEHVNKIVEMENTKVENILANINESKAVVNEHHDAALKVSNKMKALYNDSTETLNKFVPSLTCKLSSAEGKLAALSEKMHNENTNHMQHLQNDLSTNTQCVKAVAEKIDLEAKTCLAVNQTATDELLTANDSYGKSFSLAHNETDELVSKLNLNTANFIKEFVAPDHRGDTPAKVQKKYPRILAMASPRVMMKYDRMNEESSVDAGDENINTINTTEQESSSNTITEED